MSGDQPAPSSFGDPSTRPPRSTAAQKTPTHTVLPSPVFDTPKPGQGHSEDASGGCWTPRFAEEYSIFNSTPGNLRASPRTGTFAGDYGATPFTPTLPLQPGGQNKRRFSAEGIAEEIATHATHFSPDPSLPLPPVDPSRRLPSSFGAFAQAQDEIQHGQSGSEPGHQSSEPQASTPREERSPKKAKQGGPAQGASGQTVTPPPSSTRGRRKLAPKVNTSTMQNEGDFGDFTVASAAGQHANDMSAFVTSPGDVFGFPMSAMSAPASANLFTDAEQFWNGSSAVMDAMQMDFSGASTNMFQNPTQPSSGHNRSGGSLDWGRANQLFHENDMLPQQQHHQPQHHQRQPPSQPPNQPQERTGQQPVKRERPLAPKTMMPNLDTSMMDQSMLVESAIYQTPVEDHFGLAHGRAVDPGLLFSRPPSSSMDAVFDPMQHQEQHPPSSSAPPAFPQSSGQPDMPQQAENQNPNRSGSASGATVQGLGISKAPLPLAELRRSCSVKELGPSKKASTSASSSAKLAGDSRPGLSRSFSENRGRRNAGRLLAASGTVSGSSNLPALAPAIQPAPQQAARGSGGASLSRPSSHGRSSTGNGRLSPLKAHHHHRLSSLTSIPEATPGTLAAAPLAVKRTSVKFTIDANGRARVETIVVSDDEACSIVRRRRQRSSRKAAGGSRPSSRLDSTDDDFGATGDGDVDDDDDASSTDDEPIIIPSRNTSFALPDPLKVSGSRARYHQSSHRASQRSLSENSTSSSLALPGEVLGGGGGSSSNDPESEAETVMNENGVVAAGDAADELEKLRQNRQRSGMGTVGSGAKIPGSGGQRQRFTSLNVSFGRTQQQQPQQQYGSAATSPTMTEMTLPTPSTATRTGRGVRCVCDTPGANQHRDGFMVQCESCEMWLHGRCINIPKRSMMPSVYICAFCARTSHGRAGRTTVSASASSPLAHKSFAKFR